MNYGIGNRVALGLALCVAACATNPPPAAVAAGVERTQCSRGETAAQEQALVRSTTVLQASPIYSHVRTSNNNSEERVAGAKLLVRPPPGMTAEQMTRALQCYSARLLLGQVQGDGVENDPYWLPETWLNIEVAPENGNFAVTVQGDTVRDNILVYGRASRYAREHMLATDPALP